MLEEEIRRFLQIALALNASVGQRTGVEPLLSTETYDYGFPAPAWDWEEIGRQIEELRPAISSFPAARAGFLADLTTSFEMMAREGQGDRVPYAERVVAYLQVPGERVPQATIAALAEDLRGLLVAEGYADDLAIALPQWIERRSIRGEALQTLAEELMEQARTTTNERIMPLPAEHRVELSFPKNFPFNGYSAYKRDYRGTVELNGDIGWHIPALKHLVCHEAFPGHQTFSALRELRYRQGLIPVEGTLYFSNTPITPIVEGAAEIGQELLGMVKTADDRLFDVYNRYQSACATNLAFDCNADGKDQETAVREYMALTHVPRGQAERRYRFWSHPLWQTGFPHYWYGREFMQECYQRMAADVPRFVEMIYTEPHTVRTLREAVLTA
ncbi:MAG: hypothetical protein FJ011_01200 [Chloroflexi bacterium]|nr:hypothetical protein [Chloroflexota bacterium]